MPIIFDLSQRDQKVQKIFDLLLSDKKAQQFAPGFGEQHYNFLLEPNTRKLTIGFLSKRPKVSITFDLSQSDQKVQNTFNLLQSNHCT